LKIKSGKLKTKEQERFTIKNRKEKIGLKQSNKLIDDSKIYYRNMKLVILIIMLLILYFTIFGKVNKFDKLETAFSCNFIEQFVETYDLDKLCKKVFKDDLIKRYEYWSISWKMKSIQDIWDRNIEDGKGKPALKINSD